MPIGWRRDGQQDSRLVPVPKGWRRVLRNGVRRVGAQVAKVLASPQVPSMSEETRLRIEAAVLGGLMALFVLHNLVGWLP
jgi:hypothetical protein